MVIAHWSDIETNIAAILAFVLHTEAAPTMAMIQAIRSATAQMDMIEAAGSAKLADPELEIFEATILLARKAAKKRNPIAHHIWAICEELPDALLLIEPSAYLEMFVVISKALNENTAHLRNPIAEPDKSRVMVYREGDFLEIISEMKTVSKCIGHAINILHGQFPSPQKIYDLLFAEPLFVTALTAIRKDRPPQPG